MESSSYNVDNHDDEFGIFSEVNQTGTPERRLLLGILERAILDYVGNDKKEVADSTNWIFSDESAETQFSFAWVCNYLDLDPKVISDYIKSFPKRGNSRIAPWYLHEVVAA